MPVMTLFTFLFLGASFLSLWIRREPKIWGTLLGCSFVFGWIAGNITWLGFVFSLLLLLLWVSYKRKSNVFLFLLLIAFSASFKMKLLPGFSPFSFTSNFAISWQIALIGLFPLAFVVPLARTKKDWIQVLKGLFFGCMGVGVLAVLATASGATHWNFKLPSFAAARFLSNFFLTAIPEESFYRGFIQNTLSRYFGEGKWGKISALFATSLLFTAAHIYWSPNLQILTFVFLASLLYGGVYLLSGKIESAILSHFLLNFIHMTFFSYHAM